MATTSIESSVIYSRRRILGSLAAAGMMSALPALGKTVAVFPDDALRPYALSVAADPVVVRIGREAAGTRDAQTLEASIRARITGAHDEAGWRTRLLEAGRADLAGGDRVEVAGRRLIRIEADFLGLAARLQMIA